MELKKYFEQTGTTASSLASIVGVWPSAISQYANGKRQPLPSIARKIVKATRGKVRLDDLYPAEAEGERRLPSLIKMSPSLPKQTNQG